MIHVRFEVVCSHGRLFTVVDGGCSFFAALAPQRKVVDMSTAATRHAAGDLFAIVLFSCTGEPIVVMRAHLLPDRGCDRLENRN